MTDSCEETDGTIGGANYFLAPEGAHNTELVYDFGCNVEFQWAEIRNTRNGQGNDR